MSTADLTTVANAIKTYVRGKVSLTKDANTTDFMSMYTPQNSVGDTAYRFNVNYSANASTETFSEGDARGAIGRELVARGSLDYSTGYRRTSWGMTGHAKDALGTDNWYDAMKLEADEAVAKHMATQDAALISTAEAAIAATGSYAGLLRSTYKLASTVVTAGGALALSDMSSAWTTLRAAPISAPLMSGNYRIVGDAVVMQEYGDVAVATTNLPLNTVNSDSAIDPGKFKFDHYYNKIPMKTVNGVTAGTMLWLDLSKSGIIQHRAPTVVDINLNEDAEAFEISSCYIWYTVDPRRCAKILD